LAGVHRAVDDGLVPQVTFASPQVASVGLTDAQAVAAGYRCDCRVLPLQQVPRSVVNRDTRGMVKLVADAGRLLGVHAVCEAAGELIAAAGWALAAKITVTDLAEAWCPYLTMAEALKLAALSFTRDLTKLSCCTT
jgi:mercuric reductase